MGTATPPLQPSHHPHHHRTDDGGPHTRRECGALSVCGGVTARWQVVHLRQDAAAPVLIRAWSKAQGVSGANPADYSLYMVSLRLTLP